LRELLREHRLDPVAVLLTHGHFDHVLSVVPVCDGNDIPAWIHPEDRILLSDPMRGLSAEAGQLFGGRVELREPREVRVLEDGASLDLAGVTLVVDHTPGHTGGSVTFRSTTEEGVGLLVVPPPPSVASVRATRSCAVCPWAVPAEGSESSLSRIRPEAGRTDAGIPHEHDEEHRFGPAAEISETAP
jgi:hypothetical protein